MAKKADLLEQAKKLGLEVTEKNTIAEIEAAIKSADTPKEKAVEEKKSEKPAAKAGKRSEKAIKEAEEKVAKEERKASGDTSAQNPEAEQKKKGPKPITRPKIERRSKKYQKVAKEFDNTKSYELTEAIKIAEKTATTKFDSSLELHVRLGVDPRQADQNIRGTVSLPNGTGKTVRVAVFAPESEGEAAKKAGADIIGEDAVTELLKKEQLDFDILIATPQLMAKLSKFARSLGPRGLMPNPKSGTVATNIAKAVKEAKAGRVEYRVDKQGIVHLAVGKVSFGAAKLQENTQTVLDNIQAAKPSSLKASYIKAIHLTTTMGPSIQVEVKQ